MNEREKLKLRGKTRQNTQNKETFDLAGKIEIEGRTRQNAENKQAFDSVGKIEIGGNRKILVKTLEINKLLI